MNKYYDVIIIGAGAAGMTAAIFAARSGAAVCIIEHRSEPGKKILQTGNGKCNLTHENVCAADYGLISDTFEKFLETAFKSFAYNETLEFFDSIGIPVRNKGGYIYPYSGTALSVRNALWDEMKRLGVVILTDTEAHISCRTLANKENAIQKQGENFCVNVKTLKKQDGKEELSRQEIYSDRLILATGLCAAPKTGSDGSGIDLAKALGLKIKEPLPSLVKLKISGDICKPASGVRHGARVQILSEGLLLSEDMGELQFTDDGISGIPVFNVSKFVSKALYEGKPVKAVLDLFPDISEDECQSFVSKNQKNMRERKLGSFFGGLLPVKLLTAVARSLGISAEKKLCELEPESLEKLVLRCKRWELGVSGSYGFDTAQVCTGGVELDQIDPETMQVKKMPGLFVAGELADIDGPCGGYNLQWAWTSGAIAGGSV